MGEATIRVVLVDDHPMLREGTAALLDACADLLVVGQTGRGLEAIELVERLRPEVLVLDLHLPDLSGVEVARRVRASRPTTAIL